MDAGGADLEAKDEDGLTAFLLACGDRNPEIVAALVEAGCDTAAKTSAGLTGLMLAAFSCCAATVLAVLEGGGRTWRRRQRSAARRF